MVVVCPPQRDLGLFLKSPYFSCIQPEITFHNLFKLGFNLISWEVNHNIYIDV